MWDWQKILPQISNRRINWYVWNELYNMGLRPNRYPVPAIPVEVHITSSFIAVCEMNDLQYTYGVITLYP